MDQFEITKIAGAVLPALLLIFGVKTIVDSRQPGPPAKPGYTLPMPSAEAAAPAAPAGEKVAEAKPADGSAPAADAPKDGAAAAPAADAAPAAAAGGAADAVLAALPKATADGGKSLFSKCKACHTIEKGKPKGVGPNLWGVVNRAKASSEGFDYSPAMKAKGGEWTFAELAAFITAPKAAVPGTKMVFNGVPNPAETADLIAYLAAQSDTPVELPK